MENYRAGEKAEMKGEHNERDRRGSNFIGKEGKRT